MIPRRLFLVFFGDAPQPAWWARLFRPGFRHVSAAAWYSDQQRWVYVNPGRPGMRIEVCQAEEFDGRFAQLLRDSTVILRLPQQFGRGVTPWAFHCVGAVKALLGIRCPALSPYGLYRWLLAYGAEVVEVPCVGSDAAAATPCADERPIQQSGHAESGAGRSCGQGAA